MTIKELLAFSTTEPTKPVVTKVPKARPGVLHSKHHADVAYVELPTVGYRYWAACTCGYISAARINPNDASTLAENHEGNATWILGGRRDF